ncbi:MAG: type IX secretion system plug protein domain-containing protein [Cyclobacteriaceae bacterium]
MKYRLLSLFSLSVLILTSCVPVSTTSYNAGKKLLFDNVDCEDNVGMVQLFPFSQNLQSELENPVLEVGNENGFLLQFDLFEENYSSLNVRYIHCNKDWTPSGLSDIRFLNEYNSFAINNYQYSSNTRKKYVQYAVQLPSPHISGNYLVVVSNSNSNDDIIFSRRALVYDRTANAQGDIQMSSSVKERKTNQQVAFSVNYSGLNNVNPLRDIYVVLLQNHNWDVALKELKPTLVRHDESYLEFHHFNSENNFPGANEFRYFDLRSIDFKGMNVANVKKEEGRVLAFLGTDKPRGSLAYSQLIQDLNGKYFLVNSDPGDSQLQSEYVDVYFELKSDKIAGEVFVTGRFNNWTRTPENRMIYAPERNSYRGKVLLKQGYYDYRYWVESPSLKPGYFEGNYFQTTNDYEILVYYRDPINNFDELIGYKSIKSEF